MEIIDFSNMETSPKALSYGGAAGFKDGIIYRGDYWMIKIPLSTKNTRKANVSYTSSPLSEYVGSHIYDLLGIDVHETLLGICNNKLVVACKDFTKGREPLNEMRTIKNRANSDLQEMLERTLSSTGSSYMVNLDEILLHLKHNEILSKVEGIYDRFFDQIVVDAFINNNDRNNGNWGVIYNPETKCYDLAPVFDNGAAFHNKISERQLQKRLEDKETVKKDALKTVTAYGHDGKLITTKEMFSGTLPPQFQKALMRNVPKIRDKMDEIKNLLEEIPETHREIPVCSRACKEFMMLGMESRLENILIPAYETARQQEPISEKEETHHCFFALQNEEIEGDDL